MEKVTVNLGGKSYGAALPWADPSVANAAGTSAGQLDAATLARTAFFHYMTSSTVHGDQPKVMKLIGKTADGEIIASAYAKHLAPCFSTVQSEPIAVGARGNWKRAPHVLRTHAAVVSPTQLKSLLGRAARATCWSSCATCAITYARQAERSWSRRTARRPRSTFLDAMALSQTQVRKLTEQLMTTLSAITSRRRERAGAGGGGADRGQRHARSPPCGIGVRRRQPLRPRTCRREADQHVTGIARHPGGHDALGTSRTPRHPLTDKVTFATMNVFGRNLNGIAKPKSTAARRPRSRRQPRRDGDDRKERQGGRLRRHRRRLEGRRYDASDIDSATGAAGPAAATSPETMTHVAAARTLGVALG